MKILHVITSLRTGGAEKLVCDLLPLLSESGHKPELAILDGTPTHLLDSLRASGVKVHVLGMGLRSIYNPLHILRLRRLMKDFDIVHSHNSSAQIFTAIATPKGLVRVTTEHNTDNRRRHIGLLRPFDRMLYRSYTAIICCSEAVRNSLTAYLGPEFSERCRTIENGIDLSRFTPPKEAQKTETDIVMVAAFRPQKDHLTAIRALALLPPDTTLSFAGDGPTRPEAEAEVRKLGLESRVYFLGNVSDVARRFHRAKVALLSTHYEGLSLSTLEAMASGTPLVATDVNGVREVCAGAAVLTPAGDPQAMAEAIGTLLADPTRRREVVAACTARASNFDIRLTATAYSNLYLNLTRKPLPTRHSNTNNNLLIMNLSNAPKDKSKVLTLDELRIRLQDLVGTPFTLTQKPRTDGAKIRKLVSSLLSDRIVNTLDSDSYTIIPPKKKGIPRLLLEMLDTYIVTSGDKYNLQVWNRNPNSNSPLIVYKTGDSITAKDIRYVFVKINAAQNLIESVTILTNEYIEQKFGLFGKPTEKQQLLISNSDRKNIIQTPDHILLTRDSTNLTPHLSAKAISPTSTSDTPAESGKILPLDAIRDKIADHLIGITLSAPDTKSRGQQLEKEVIRLLGYGDDSKLVGSYPDIPNQLLEVKVQDSQTIDLGKYTPQFPEIINSDIKATTKDVRYLIALTNPQTHIIEGLILMSGEKLEDNFTFVSDKSYKCQRTIPMTFFNSQKNKCVTNP